MNKGTDGAQIHIREVSNHPGSYSHRTEMRRSLYQKKFLSGSSLNIPKSQSLSRNSSLQNTCVCFKKEQNALFRAEDLPLPKSPVKTPEILSVCNKKYVDEHSESSSCFTAEENFKIKEVIFRNNGSWISYEKAVQDPKHSEFRFSENTSCFSKGIHSCLRSIPVPYESVNNIVSWTVTPEGHRENFFPTNNEELNRNSRKGPLEKTKKETEVVGSLEISKNEHGSCVTSASEGSDRITGSFESDTSNFISNDDFESFCEAVSFSPSGINPVPIVYREMEKCSLSKEEEEVEPLATDLSQKPQCRLL